MLRYLECGGMAFLVLREAAEQAGMSKTSIFRAIKSGRLSATRDDNGGIRIDPAELARAFPPKPFQQERSRAAFQEPEGMARGMAERERNGLVAALETEVRLLRQIVPP